MTRSQLRPARAALTSLSLLALCGCGGAKLPDYNVLGELRVLALQAEPPEVDPAAGTSVTITPVVSDLNGGRNLSYVAVGCVDPGVGYGATPSCTSGTSAGEVTALGSGTIPDPDSTNHTHTGTGPTLTLTVPPTILSKRSVTDQYNGVAYLVIYTLTATATDGSTSQVTAFKRVIATTRGARNTNPTVTELNVTTNESSQTLGSYLLGLSFPVADGTKVDLTAALGAGAAESYTLMNSDGSLRSLTEQPTTTWFISDGEATYYRTVNADTNSWTVPKTQPTAADGTPRKIIVVGVTRDGRGGEGFKIVE